MRIHFVLISEGPSDNGLIPHLEALCIECGATEVTGTAPDLRRLPKPVGHSVVDKLRVILALEPEANLIFIHRDADRSDARSRHDEIAAATIECNLQKLWVAVVPVQETEAWLLLDEAAIKQVAGNPNSKIDLRLPTAANVESVANPKELLQQKILLASEATGRRLERLRAEFSRQRQLLLLRLPIDGTLAQVPAWHQLRVDLERALATLSPHGQRST